MLKHVGLDMGQLGLAREEGVIVDHRKMKKSLVTSNNGLAIIGYK